MGIGSVSVIHEDEEVLVINKPSGLLSHSTKHGEEGLIELIQMQRGPDHFLVHRLDRDTSGVILVAKSLLCQLKLQKLFQEKKVSKLYLGIVDKPLKAKKMEIDLSVGKSKSKELRMVINRALGKDFKRAITYATWMSSSKVDEEHYRARRKQLIKLETITGRTHQIRTHLLHVGSPLLNDPVYGQIQDDYGQYLHAHQLTYVCPFKKQHVKFVAPMENRFRDKLNELQIPFVEGDDGKVNAAVVED